MSTVIRFKRKKLSETNNGIDNVKLLPGEPLYNLNNNHFYIGNSTGTPDDITKITSESDASNVVSFHIGSDSNNKYEKIINNVENVTGQINGKDISFIFEKDGTTVKSATSAATVTDKIKNISITDIFESDGTTSGISRTVQSATYASPDPRANTIHTRLLNLEHKTENLDDESTLFSGTSDDLYNLDLKLVEGKSTPTLKLTWGKNKDHQSKEVSITGNIAGNIDTATKLKTSRKIQVDLSNTYAADFDGSKNIQPGVKGVLQTQNGGTGVATLNELKATSTKLGLVKVGYTKNGSKLPVELENDQMFVDTTSTTTKIEKLEEQLTWETF